MSMEFRLHHFYTTLTIKNAGYTIYDNIYCAFAVIDNMLDWVRRYGYSEIGVCKMMPFQLFKIYAVWYYRGVGLWKELDRSGFGGELKNEQSYFRTY